MGEARLSVDLVLHMSCPVSTDAPVQWLPSLSWLAELVNPFSCLSFAKNLELKFTRGKCAVEKAARHPRVRTVSILTY